MESRQKLIHLPGDDSQLIQLSTGSLHSGRMYSSKETEVGYHMDFDFYSDSELERLVRCWIFGDKLAVSTLQDASVDAVIPKMAVAEHTPVNFYGLIHSSIVGNNRLKRLVVDIAAGDTPAKTSTWTTMTWRTRSPTAIRLSGFTIAPAGSPET